MIKYLYFAYSEYYPSGEEDLFLVSDKKLSLDEIKKIINVEHNDYVVILTLDTETNKLGGCESYTGSDWCKK